MLKEFTKLVLICFVITALPSCINDDKRIGQFGDSDNIEQSKASNLFVTKYVPNKFEFKLIDNSIIKIDTAWAESQWIYDDKGQSKKVDSLGFNLIIPILKQDFNSFKFTFSALDTLNVTFSNGIQENKCVINPKVLYDTVKILIEQKNTDTTLGWTKPIVRDTIDFIKK